MCTGYTQSINSTQVGEKVLITYVLIICVQVGPHYIIIYLLYYRQIWGTILIRLAYGCFSLSVYNISHNALFFIIDQNIINENYNKSIHERKKDLIHEIHENSWSISRTKRQDQKFIVSVTRSKCNFWNVRFFNFQLIVIKPQINL